MLVKDVPASCIFSAVLRGEQLQHAIILQLKPVWSRTDWRTELYTEPMNETILYSTER